MRAVHSPALAFLEVVALLWLHGRVSLSLGDAGDILREEMSWQRQLIQRQFRKVHVNICGNGLVAST